MKIFLFVFLVLQTPAIGNAAKAPFNIQNWNTQCLKQSASELDDIVLIEDFIKRIRLEVDVYDKLPVATDIQFDDVSIRFQRRLEPLLAGIGKTFILNGHRCIESILSQLVGLAAKLPDSEAVNHPVTTAISHTLKEQYQLSPTVQLFHLSWEILFRARTKKDLELTDKSESLVMEAIQSLSKYRFQIENDAIVTAPIFLEFISAGVLQRGRNYPESAYTVVTFPALEKIIFRLFMTQESSKIALGKSLLNRMIFNIVRAIQQAEKEGINFFDNGYDTDLMVKGIDILANIHCYVGVTDEVRKLITGVQKIFSNQKVFPPRIAVAKSRFEACNQNTTANYFSFVTED